MYISEHRHLPNSDKFSSTWADARLRSTDDDDDMHLPASRQRLKISFKATPSHGGGGDSAASVAAIAEAATAASKATNIALKTESQPITSRDSRGKINIKSFPNATTSPAPQADNLLVLIPVFTHFPFIPSLARCHMLKRRRALPMARSCSTSPTLTMALLMPSASR